MRIVITGSSGLIGAALTGRLRASGHDVVRLVRGRASAPDEVAWSPDGGVLDAGVLTGADAVVNLNGRSIGAERWDEEERRLVRDSRIGPTGLLARAIADLDGPRPVFLSASAIGYYGDRGDDVVTEHDGPGDGFLARVCVDWEAATAPAADAGARVVLLRTGIVLSSEDGALERMLTPFKLGVGGRIGDGRQWWSWISLADETAAIEHLLTSALSGPINLVAPNPVTNREFTDSLGSVLRRPTLLPVPRLALDVLLGRELAETLLYTSARVEPRRLLEDGFVFEHPHVEAALREEIAA